MPPVSLPIPEDASGAADLHCDIVLADTDWVVGACVARGLVAGGCIRSLWCPANVSPRGFRLWGELDAPVFPAGDDVLDCRCFRRSSVSLKRASRASSSWLCEFTACFLVVCQHTNTTEGNKAWEKAYFFSTD